MTPAVRRRAARRSASWGRRGRSFSSLEEGALGPACMRVRLGCAVAIWVYTLFESADQTDARSADGREECPRKAQARTPPAPAAAALFRLPEDHERTGIVPTSSLQTFSIIYVPSSRLRQRLRKQLWSRGQSAVRDTRVCQPPVSPLLAPSRFETANPARAPCGGKTPPLRLSKGTSRRETSNFRLQSRQRVWTQVFG
jgi:hypothetical protein